MYEWLIAHLNTFYVIGAFFVGMLANYYVCVRPMKKDLRKVTKDYVINREKSLNDSVKYIFLLHYLSQTVEWLNEKEIQLPDHIIMGLQTYELHTFQELHALNKEGFTYFGKSKK